MIRYSVGTNVRDRKNAAVMKPIKDKCSPSAHCLAMSSNGSAPGRFFNPRSSSSVTTNRPTQKKHPSRPVSAKHSTSELCAVSVW